MWGDPAFVAVHEYSCRYRRDCRLSSHDCGAAGGQRHDQ